MSTHIEHRMGTVFSIDIRIADPHDRTRLVSVVCGHDFAVATSGTAERGRHFVGPFTRRPALPGLVSATVVGPSIVTADVYATAAFVLGAGTCAWLDSVAGYELYAVAEDRTVVTSASWANAATMRRNRMVACRTPNVCPPDRLTG